MTGAIRPARSVDAAHLPAIERAAGKLFETLPDLAWLSGSEPMAAADHLALIRAGTSWVAEVDAALAGFLAAERIGRDLHIVEVSVAPAYQGRGLGRRLIEAALAHARPSGFAALTLTTFRDVAWNGPFYARLGFAEVPEHELCPRLAGLLADEERRGLPRARRRAMRLSLSG